MYRTIRIFVVSATLMMVALLAFPAAQPAHAISERCFPETGQCIDGRFRQYWEENGGLPVFGLPKTPPRNEINQDTGQTYLPPWS